MMSTAALNAGPRPALGRAMAALSLVGAAASWGLATVMTKATLATLPPFTLLTIQLAGSITFLWVAVLLLRQSMRLDLGLGARRCQDCSSRVWPMPWRFLALRLPVPRTLP